MNITLQDRSHYFRGLLLLISMDRTIALPERRLLLRIGKALDFERAFCEIAIDDILENRHIVREPPVFSSRELAGKFILDGLTLAMADGEVHSEEVEWLSSVAGINSLETAWFEHEKRIHGRNTDDLEVDHLMVG